MQARADTGAEAGLGGEPGRRAPVEVLSSVKILKRLEPDTLKSLAKIAQPIQLNPGDLIIKDKDLTDDLFFIEEGQVEIFRTLGDGTRESRFGILAAGEPVGEMALLDGEPRSASARAITPCSLLRIRVEDVQALPHGEHIFADLKACVAVAITRRARDSTDKTIAALEGELKARQEQHLFGQFFIYMLGVMAIGTVVNNILARGALDVDIYTQQFAWEYLLILFIPSALVMIRMGIPFNELGITTKGLKKSLLEGALASVLLIVAAFGGAQILAAYGLVPGKPLPFDPAGALAYFFHSLLQELVARGFMQSSFQRFLNDEKGWQSVLLTGILFGLFHLHFGLPAVAVTIASSFVFGALYLRHRNLAGVTLLHFMSGVAAFNSGLL